MLTLGGLVLTPPASKSITDAQLSAFRGELREITTREIMKLRGTRRAEVLHEMIAIRAPHAGNGLEQRPVEQALVQGANLQLGALPRLDETLGLTSVGVAP